MRHTCRTILADERKQVERLPALATSSVAADVPLPKAGICADRMRQLTANTPYPPEAVQHLRNFLGANLLQIEVSNKLDSFLEAVRRNAVRYQADLEVLGQSGCPALCQAQLPLLHQPLQGLTDVDVIAQLLHVCASSQYSWSRQELQGLMKLAAWWYDQIYRLDSKYR